MGLTRRGVLRAGYSGSAALVCAFLAPPGAGAADETTELIEGLVGGRVTRVGPRSPRDAAGLPDRLYGAHGP